MRRVSVILYTILILSSITFINNHSPVSASTIYVSIDGSEDYIKIQDAIDNANIGDTVYVYNGSYYENIIIGKEIILTGEDKTNTIINGNNDNIIHISSDNVEVNGFTIKNGLNGIYITNSSDCTISLNTIIDNNIGISIDNLSSDNIIFHNNFINNIDNAHDDGNNKWHNTKFREGNYWSDYDRPNEGAYDNDTDGIVDMPYSLSVGSNDDLYPFIEAFTDQPNVGFKYKPSEPFTYELIEFSDTSFDSDGYIVSWFWDLGNGNTSNSRNTSSKYFDDGVYNVSLEVTDNYGVISKVVKQITILNTKPIPIFTYTPSQPDDVKNVTFFDESFDIDGVVVNWKWDLGDGTTLLNPKNPKVVSHKYDDNGNYKVTLIVYDDDGAINSTTIDIVVLNVKPTASFYYRSVSTDNINITEKEEVKFFDRSKDDDGEIVRYNWDFGDDKTSNLESPTHVFERRGTYNIILTVYDDDDASDSKQIRVNVLAEGELAGTSKGIGLFEIGALIFILVMVGVVIFLSKKYGS